jgi:hypothetical protein
MRVLAIKPMPIDVSELSCCCGAAVRGGSTVENRDYHWKNRWLCGNMPYRTVNNLLLGWQAECPGLLIDEE